MNHNTSLFKIGIFTVAIFADLQYLVFLLNPAHWGNIFFFILSLTADLIMLVVFTTTWITCLYFEVFKHRYYYEVDHLREKGKALCKKKTAILIPVVKEDLAVVKKTVEAVLKIRGKTEIHLLDDGGRMELKKFAEKVGVNYHHRSSRDFFKAGNLNFGLTKIDAPFVAVFDSDYLPEPAFLEQTLPLFIDDTVGAVQTPQAYYNDDNIFARGMKNIESIFYRFIMPAKHLLNSAFCVGTNVVYRTEALTKIGGITKIDHSEDIFTSLSLVEHGYRIFYLDEVLAYGLAPTTIVSFFNQQFRWALGGLSMLLHHSPVTDKKLSFDQRIQFASSNLFYLSGLAIAIYLFSPFVVLFFNLSPINPIFFKEWLQAYGLFFLTNTLFFALLLRARRLETMMLGLTSCIPYVYAIIAALFQTTFHWKETNFLSRDVVTRLLAPLIFYLILCITVVNLFLTRLLGFRLEYVWYIVWMAINSALIFVVILESYRHSYDKRGLA